MIKDTTDTIPTAERFNFSQLDNLFQISHEITPYQKQALLIQTIMDAASSGDLEIVKKYYKEDLVHMKSITNYDDRSLLHQSVLYNHTETVKYFLGMKFDVNAKDRWGLTPLDYATHQTIRKYLTSEKKPLIQQANNSLRLPGNYEKMN